MKDLGPFLRTTLASLDGAVEGEAPHPITDELRRLRRETEVILLIGLASPMTQAMWAAALPYLGVERSSELVRNLLQLEPEHMVPQQIRQAAVELLDHRVMKLGWCNTGDIVECAVALAEAVRKQRMAETQRRRA